MRHHHQVRRGATLVIICVVVLIAPVLGPVAVGAQDAYCRVEVTLENRTRRVRGRVNAECGDECTVGFCHDAPWGNWGVTSGYGPRIDADQFAGWDPHGNQLHWNSCTDHYNDTNEHFNDGPGRQRAAPDDEQSVGTGIIWYYAGARQQDTCDDHLPEVRVDRFTMELWELDPGDFDDHVSDLDYVISTPITCSTDWNCSGTSFWYYSRSTDAARTSAFARISVSSRFSW